MAEPTVIDSLIVTLGLDPSDYTKGQKQAAADLVKTKNTAISTAKEMEDRGKQGARFFGQIKSEALGLFAVVVGSKGLADFAANTVTNLSAAGRAAKAMGMEVSQLSAFQNMIVRNGGSAEAAKASLQGVSQAIEQLRVTGNSPMLPWLNRVGASANDSPFAVYEKFTKWAEGKDAKQVNLVGQNLGFDEATINQAMKGSRAVAEAMAESYRLGVPNDAQIAKVQALQQAFIHLRQAVLGDAQAMLEDAAPALIKILGLVDSGIEKYPVLTKLVLGLGTALTVMGAAKIGAGVLGLLGGGAGAAAAGAAGGGAVVAGAEVAGGTLAAAGGGALAAGAAGRAAAQAAIARLALIRAIGAWAGPLGGLMLALTPTEANAGEGEALARARAKMGRSKRTTDGNGAIDHDLAIRTLIGEALAGDGRGQMDVAHVIKNRMNITGKGAGDIVLQPKQFSAWNTEAQRKRLMAIDKNSPAYLQAQKSWWAAMNEADPTGGATMYYAPKGMKDGKPPAWDDRSKTTLAREGHIFQTGPFPGSAAGRAGSGAPSNAPVTINAPMTIGQLTIQTQATDAPGIARDIGGALRKQRLAVQANTGLN